MSTMERVMAAANDMIAADYEASQLRARYLTEAARFYYAGCTSVVGSHPLFESVGFSGPPFRGLRVDHHGLICVPAYKGVTDLVGLVRIRQDGEQEIYGGTSLNRTSYTMQRTGATVTVVTDSFRDGMLLHRAIPNSRVVVAWEPDNCRWYVRDMRGLVVLTFEPWASYWQGKVAARLGKRLRESIGQIQRAVDAEINDILMREAKWIA